MKVFDKYRNVVPPAKFTFDELFQVMLYEPKNTVPFSMNTAPSYLKSSPNATVDVSKYYRFTANNKTQFRFVINKAG